MCVAGCQDCQSLYNGQQQDKPAAFKVSSSTNHDRKHSLRYALQRCIAQPDTALYDHEMSLTHLCIPDNTSL